VFIAFVRGLWEPSGRETPGVFDTLYRRGMEGVGHSAIVGFLFGAGATQTAWPWLVLAGLVAGYWLIKERRDLRHGAERLDSRIDTAQTAIGAAVFVFFDVPTPVATTLTAALIADIVMRWRTAGGSDG